MPVSLSCKASYNTQCWFFRRSEEAGFSAFSHRIRTSSPFFSTICTLCEKQRVPSKSCRKHFGSSLLADCETPIISHETRVGSIPSQVTGYAGFEGRRPLGAGRRSPPLVTGMSFTTEYLKPATPSRNLLLKPYILWQRDSEPLPTVGVYLGHLSSQDLQMRTLKPGEANSCNPLLQSS